MLANLTHYSPNVTNFIFVYKRILCNVLLTNISLSCYLFYFFTDILLIYCASLLWFKWLNICFYKTVYLMLFYFCLQVKAEGPGAQGIWRGAFTRSSIPTGHPHRNGPRFDFLPATANKLHTAQPAQIPDQQRHLQGPPAEERQSLRDQLPHVCRRDAAQHRPALSEDSLSRLLARSSIPDGREPLLFSRPEQKGVWGLGAQRGNVLNVPVINRAEVRPIPHTALCRQQQVQRPQPDPQQPHDSYLREGWGTHRLWRPMPRFSIKHVPSHLSGL